MDLQHDNQSLASLPNNSFTRGIDWMDCIYAMGPAIKARPVMSVLLVKYDPACTLRC